MPRKIASVKKAKPSRENGIPMTEPASSMKRGQSSPSSKERTVPDTAPTANRMAVPRPALGEIEVDGIARPLPATLCKDHEHGHRDPDDGEDDMKRERHRHLRPGGKQIGHDE